MYILLIIQADFTFLKDVTASLLEIGDPPPHRGTSLMQPKPLTASVVLVCNVCAMTSLSLLVGMSICKRGMLRVI